MAEQKDRVVLAYSGGLDTSVCIKWLQDEKNLDVIALVGDVGQEHDGLEQVKQKALRTGAIECIVADMREEFAEYYLTCAIAANALYENKYPLLSALSRPLISKHLVDIAHEYGAKYVAHGCTGKGNDRLSYSRLRHTVGSKNSIVSPQVKHFVFNGRQISRNRIIKISDMITVSESKFPPLVFNATGIQRREITHISGRERNRNLNQHILCFLIIIIYCKQQTAIQN